MIFTAFFLTERETTMRISKVDFATRWSAENRKPWNDVKHKFPKYEVSLRNRKIANCEDTTFSRTLEDALTYALARDDKQFEITIYVDREKGGI